MTFTQMLKIELYKLQRFDFYLFAGLYLFLIIGIPIGMNSVLAGAISLPAAVQLMHSISIKLMFFGIIVALAREYSHNVNRKRLLNGYKRHELLLSQLIIIGIYALTIFLLSFIALPVIAVLLGDFSALGEVPWFWYLGLLLSNFAWGLFAVFLVNIFRRALWAVLIYFGLVFVELVFKILGQWQLATSGNNKMVYFSQMELMNFLSTFNGFTLGLLLALVAYILAYQLISLWLIKRADF